MSQRIWLDATLEEEEDGLAADLHLRSHPKSHPQHHNSYPVPPVPPLPAAAFEAALVLDRPIAPPARPSTTSITGTTGTTRRAVSSSTFTPVRSSSSTAIPTTPAPRLKRHSEPRTSSARLSTSNQELISNLIDSLASIAVPARQHFETLPGPYHASSTPSSPGLSLSPYPHSLSREDDDYDLGGHPHGRPQPPLPPLPPLDAEEAAEPPVIRTSKPPSGLSQLTAPRTASKASSLRDYILSSRRSSASLNGQRAADDDARSASNLSIDTSKDSSSRRPSGISVDTSPPKKSRVRSLVYTPSRERLRPKDRPKASDAGKQATISTPNSVLTLDQRPEPPRRYSSATGQSSRKRSLQTPSAIHISARSPSSSAPPSATFAPISPPLTPLSSKTPVALSSAGPDSPPEDSKPYGNPGKRPALEPLNEFDSSPLDVKEKRSSVDASVVPLRRSSLGLYGISPKSGMKQPVSGSSSRSASASMAPKPRLSIEKELPLAPANRFADVTESIRDDRAMQSNDDINLVAKRGGRKVDSGIDKGLGGEEDVLRRIQELKAQKEQRERELARAQLSLSGGQSDPSSDRTPGTVKSFETASMSAKGSTAGTIQETQGNNHQQNRRPQPLSRLSHDGQPVLSPVKAHKLLGLSGASSPTTPGESGSDVGEPLQQEKTKLTIKPSKGKPAGEPLTPTSLPIDYSLIMQRLDRKGAPPKETKETNPKKFETPTLVPTAERSLPTSTIADETPSNTTKFKKLPQPPRPVGGRSAAARHRTKSMYVNADISPRSISPSTPEALKPDVPVKDGASDDSDSTPSRQVNSLDGEASKNMDRQRPQRSLSTSARKKRWSHPDLPLGIHQMKRSNTLHNDLAVKPIEDRPPEELVRPDTASSVEAEVSAFLNHPRLSKKIRHPQTGRTIAFSDVGDPDGHVVIVCVGMGLTRYITTFYDELAATLRLRLITPDRPGVGDSAVDANGTPLSWPDDVAEICRNLGVKRFSVLAHSAGAIYALAVALRMGEMVRGKVHLLAPWIPPSQMSGALGSIAQNGTSPQPNQGLTRSQRFLRVLPTSFLRVANSGLLGVGSASVGKKALSPQPTNKNRKKQPEAGSPPQTSTRRESIMLMDQQTVPSGLATSRSAADLRNGYLSPAVNGKLSPEPRQSRSVERRSREHDEARALAYDTELTMRTWTLATTNSNPAVDLLICLERERTIGFRYVDITRPVVIHHGTKDTRVPIDNVRWLGKMMKKCEVRILEGEGHGLMASASVMGGILMDIGDEWSSWERASRGDRGRREGGRTADHSSRF